MGNALKNAGGLDGILNWNVSGGGALAVDESAIGAPGRGVFVLTGAAQAAQAVSIYSDNIAVQGVAELEAYGYSRGADNLHVDFLDGSGTQLSTVQLPRVSNGGGSDARRGLLFTFDFASARIPVPQGALQARLSPGAQVGAGAYALNLTRPYLAAAPSYGRPTVWDPGSHSNPDLQLPVWPSQLPPFQADSLPEPIPNMVGYASDTNIQATRDLYTGLQFNYRGHMRLNFDQVDVLEQFYDANRDGFFALRPDTNQLCVARWLPDGAPKPTQSAGIWTMYEVGLRLAVA